MSSEMPWVKIYTEVLDDPKIGPLSDRLKWRFTEACLLAGECDASGYLINGGHAMTLEDVAWRIRTTVEKIKPDYDELMKLGVIVWDEERKGYLLPNFEKRQGRPQHEKREQWREWQQTHRRKDVMPDKEDVSNDAGLSHANRGEERSLEEIRGEERRASPHAANSHLFTSTEKGALAFGMMKAEFKSTTDHYETNAQRDAFLEVFECLNGELDAVVKKGLSKGIRTKGDMLVWLQGCAKASAAKQTKTKRDKAGKTYR